MKRKIGLFRRQESEIANTHFHGKAAPVWKIIIFSEKSSELLIEMKKKDGRYSIREMLGGQFKKIGMYGEYEVKNGIVKKI